MKIPKDIWLIFAAIIVVGLVCTYVQGATYMDSICRVSNGAGTGTGTAFQSDQNGLYVLTNAHVVGGANRVNCTFWKDGHQSRGIRGTVIWKMMRDGITDVAIINIPRSNLGGWKIPTIPFEHPSYKHPNGAMIRTAGCAAGKWATCIRGHIVRHDPTQLQYRFLPAPAGGRSGSPILNEDASAIIGLIAWRKGDQTGTNGAAMDMENLYRAFNGQGPSSRAAHLTHEYPIHPLVKNWLSFLPGETVDLRPVTFNVNWQGVQCPGGICPLPPQGGGRWPPLDPYQSPGPNPPYDNPYGDNYEPPRPGRLFPSLPWRNPDRTPPQPDPGPAPPAQPPAPPEPPTLPSPEPYRYPLPTPEPHPYPVPPTGPPPTPAPVPPTPSPPVPGDLDPPQPYPQPPPINFPNPLEGLSLGTLFKIGATFGWPIAVPAFLALWLARKKLSGSGDSPPDSPPGEQPVPGNFPVGAPTAPVSYTLTVVPNDSESV